MKKEICFFCGKEIKNGEKINWITENGLIVLCHDCDKNEEKSKLSI
jgi:ribosomal protein L24E